MVAVARSATTIASAHSPTLTKICGPGTDSGEIVAGRGQGSSVRTGRSLMRAWRRADNPSRFRGDRCGDVAGTHIDLARDER